MAGSSHAAGPEWAYLAPLTRSPGVPTDLDSLFVNVIVTRKTPKPSTETKVLNLQTIISRQGHLYGPHDVTRFSFSKFRELTDTWDLELFFYEGTAKEGVAIPDESAFQRLLLAVRHLGFGTPLSPTNRAYNPPVIKFFARPKPPPKMDPLVAAFLPSLVLLVLLIVFGPLRGFEAEAVMVWFLVSSMVMACLNNPPKKDAKKRYLLVAPRRNETNKADNVPDPPSNGPYF